MVWAIVKRKERKTFILDCFNLIYFSRTSQDGDISEEMMIPRNGWQKSNKMQVSQIIVEFIRAGKCHLVNGNVSLL